MAGSLEDLELRQTFRQAVDDLLGGGDGWRTRRAITVASIDFVSDPRLKRVSGVTGSPVITSATPW
jgi:hypothetical protein